MNIYKPDRIPRKIKKKIIKQCGRSSYRMIMSGTLGWKRDIICLFNPNWTEDNAEKPYIYKDTGKYTLYAVINDEK